MSSLPCSSSSQTLTPASDTAPPDESTYLLPKLSLSLPSSTQDGASQQPADAPAPLYKQWASEALVLTKSSVPIILAYMLQNSLQTVSVLMAGRLGPEALATAAFSYMFAMATAWLIALGGTTALDTLASSSYTGSADKHDLGILLQRGLFVLSGFYAVIAVVWWFSEGLFRALGQDEYICVQSAMFLKILIPGGLGYIWFESMKKYLQAQEIYRPGTYVLLITSPLSALLNYLLIHKLNLGLYGAPIATGLAYWASFLLLVAYAALVRGHECWGGLAPRRALTRLGPFARLALLGLVHVGTEWWAFEIVALAAGRLGPDAVPLAAQSVIMTADQVLNTMPFGLGVAASARVGNLLGARRARRARLAARCAAALSVLAGALVGAALTACRRSFGRVFNEDAAVVAEVARVLPFVALFQVADGLNGSCGGVLRGTGRQWVGAAVNIVSYYCGALPAGIYLAFHGWGLAGFWVGQCVALYLVGAFEWAIVALVNWDKEVERALGRLEAGGLGAAGLREVDPREGSAGFGRRDDESDTV